MLNIRWQTLTASQMVKIEQIKTVDSIGICSTKKWEEGDSWHCAPWGNCCSDRPEMEKLKKRDGVSMKWIQTFLQVELIGQKQVRKLFFMLLSPLKHFLIQIFLENDCCPP